MSGHVGRVVQLMRSLVMVVLRVGVFVETLPALVLIVLMIFITNTLVGCKIRTVPGVARPSLLVSRSAVSTFDIPVLLIGQIFVERVPPSVSRPLPISAVTVASVAMVTALLVMTVGPLAHVWGWRGLESVNRVGFRKRLIVCSLAASGLTRRRAPDEAPVLRIIFKGKL